MQKWTFLDMEPMGGMKGEFRIEGESWGGVGVGVKLSRVEPDSCGGAGVGGRVFRIG